MGRNKKNRNKSKLPTSVEGSQKPRIKAAPLFVSLRTQLILCGILAALAIFLYAGSYGHDFAYDDIAVVKSNRFVQKGLGGIGDILTTQYFEGFDPVSNARAYRPISLFTYAIEYEYFGLNTKVYHTTNILLYALTAVVLFFVLIKLFKNYHWLLAFLTTLLFVVHPVHVDIVANIKSRDELLGFFNFCVAVLFLLKNLDTPKPYKKLISFLFFFLAIASKETLLTTVACIPLLLYFFSDMTISRIGRATWPYAILFIVFLLIRASIIPSADENLTLMSYLDNPILAAKNINERIATNISALGLYLQNLIFPYRLSSDYSYNSIPVTTLGNPSVIIWLLLYIFLVIVAFKGLRQKSIFSFCILWFFITISIVSSIFIVSSNAYADRFLYTPSLAVCIAAAFGLYKLAGITKVEFSLTSAFGARQLTGVILLFFIVIISVIKTISYVPVWKNDATLFAYNVEANPQNARMHFNYGAIFIAKAMAIRDEALLQKKPIDTARIKSLARQGLHELQKGKAIFDGDAIAYVHEGNAWMLLENLPESEKNLRHALSISNNNRFAILSLGSVLYNTRRFQEAADTWEKISPDLRTTGDYYNLSIAYQALGDQQKAVYYRQLSGM